jgi:hypothetical protein
VGKAETAFREDGNKGTMAEADTDGKAEVAETVGNGEDSSVLGDGAVAEAKRSPSKPKPPRVVDAAPPKGDSTAPVEDPPNGPPGVVPKPAALDSAVVVVDGALELLPSLPVEALVATLLVTDVEP